jgi:hypothetical protein
LPLLKIDPVLLGLKNILSLAAFVTTTKKNDYAYSYLGKVNAITRAIINPKF